MKERELKGKIINHIESISNINILILILGYLNNIEKVRDKNNTVSYFFSINASIRFSIKFKYFSSKDTNFEVIL